MKKSKNKKRLYIGALVVIIVSIVAYFVFSGEKESLYDYAVAERADIVQEISVTGKVEPAEDADLAFEKGGKVLAVYYDVGEYVKKGYLLVQLKSADIMAQLDSAKATLKVQQAKLNELTKGTRLEEIQVQEVKVANAEVALNDAKQNLFDKLQDAYTKADDAVRTKVDELFDGPRGTTPQINFSMADSVLESEIENLRIMVEDALTELQESVSGFSVSDDLDAVTMATKNNLSIVKTFLEKLALAISSLEVTSTLAQATIGGWETSVSTARTNVNTATVNLSAADEKLKTAGSTLSLKKQELELLLAGNTEEKINAQKAQVEKAEADVSKYQADLSKMFIYSPITGVVTVQDANVGEIVAANTILISIISDSGYEIKANVPEVDIVKTEIGDIAKVTLDAYGDDVIFSAVVVKIDPAETMIEGVPSYKTTLQFDRDDERVRSGMTANLDIITDMREGVVVVPQRAVITQNGNKFVRILQLMESSKKESIDERVVVTGLKDNFGNIEIVEGVAVGEKVVTFVKEKQ